MSKGLPQVETRAATAGDGSDVASLHRASALVGYAGIFPPASVPPTAKSLEPAWSDLIARQDSAVFLAHRRGSLVGVVAVAVDETMPSGLSLARLYVLPSVWGQGIGALLHDLAMTHAIGLGAEAINLWVLEANTRGRAMYERRGWRLVQGRTLANNPPTIIDVLYERKLSIE